VHQGHWSGVISPLESTGLHYKIFILSNLFQLHSLLEKNKGISVLLLVSKKNVIYFTFSP
jgi:hypothetical protein